MARKSKKVMQRQQLERINRNIELIYAYMLFENDKVLQCA